jgi:type IV pilus assembly protein PilY1
MPNGNYPIFGAVAGTPAVATLFMDPGDGGGRREIGVAILPGGSDGLPTTTGSCLRQSQSSGASPVDSFPARTNVRCWNASLKQGDPVNGRAVAIVRVDTGEILRVFTRLNDVPTGDTLRTHGRIIDTPLDSPMTGMPLVYPNDVGSNATKFFVTDADGTMWRFDVSSPDPVNWKGELFVDLYNTTVDSNATAWSDGQPASVPATITVDPSGQVVINVATGTTDTFDSTQIDTIYSITEEAQGSPLALRAHVNWYLVSPLSPPSSPPPAPISPQPSNPSLLPGERVSGPMTVFDSKLYFATYAAGAIPPAGQAVTTCPQNIARIWALDFERSADTMNCSNLTSSSSCDRTKGGVPMLTVTGRQDLVANTQPVQANGSVPVIPGVSLSQTPACAGGGNPQTDQYVAGAQHVSPTNLTAGTYAVSAQLGQTNPSGPGAATLSMSVPPPMSPTVIDSWAPVIE